MPRISDVKPAQRWVQLQIRVIRKWKNYKNNRELCYLFVDTYGDAIEATADVNNEEYFDSKMAMQQCYTIDNYISIPARTTMRVVPHDASIRLGSRVTFQPLSETTIPTYYYNLASYKDLEARKPNPKPLTDYLGRIENVSPLLTRAGKRIRKVMIQDEQSHSLEVTFWTEDMFPYNKEEVIRKTLLVTSTLVTEYMQKLQLESTAATVIEIDPQAPELQDRISRLNQLPKTGPTATDEIISTITDIFKKHTDDSKQSRFTCKAAIKEITTNRKWYYVTCPHCPKKPFLQEDKTYECEDHGPIAEPIFMYCVNTTIADKTMDAKAVFFNEAMSEMLNISCTNMVVGHGYTNPLIIPPQISGLIGKSTIFHVTVKSDNTMTVNRITSPTTSASATTSKRKLEHPPGPQTPSKQPYR